jgi:hypothetical protein
MIFCFVLFFLFLFSFFGLVLLDYISIFTYYRVKDKKGVCRLESPYRLKNYGPMQATLLGIVYFTTTIFLKFHLATNVTSSSAKSVIGAGLLQGIYRL